MKDDIINPTFELVHKKDFKRSEVFQNYQKLWSNKALFQIVGKGPIQLDIELNTTCNYKCIMCFHSFDPPTPEIMKPWNVKDLIDQGIKIGVKSLKLNYRGEPLMYKALSEIISYAREKGILETFINTNASLLTADLSKSLIKAGLGRMTCSLDGIKPETYSKIRVGGNLKTVTANIIRLQSLKKLYGSETPIVRIQIVEQSDNKDELPEFIEYWSKIADEVAVVSCKDYTGKIEETTELPDWYCSQLWQRLFILADGTILPCCRATEGGNKRLYILGDANTITVEEAWKSPKLRLLRKAHSDGMSHTVEMCRKCGLRKEVIKQYV